ncbi:uncharacterized protein (TIGR01440 family) [Chryseomicrobium aureum]|uniref:TIGR01440 family protein n=1 Tax=Chryseomicrobium aureum TaxID=1441723 RepID=UPI0019596204|nr:TIGR01440 family protein [Chryseomicrobium aureum]MBM7706162.1 uncharacterized protein (TIGR01440 family) [Chryseomicrobium aureum]
MEATSQWKAQLEQLLNEFEQLMDIKPATLFVVGCSTSEVIGKKIGTAGATEVAEALFEPLEEFARRKGVYLAFQGCEHINRALTMCRETADKFQLEEVSVIPVPSAGGSMSAYAYEQFHDPVVVENIRAHAGIDIGQTLIGMHLKEVAVPVRTSVKMIGDAIVTTAATRPKLIGGRRAFYGN